MEKPDVEALLKQNPNVDREALKRYLERQVDLVQKPQKRGSTSPYSGRRLTPADKTRWTGRYNTTRPKRRAI